MDKAFEILDAALPRLEVSGLATLLLDLHKRENLRYPGQTGFQLQPWADKLACLGALEYAARQLTGSLLKLRLDRSSCRLQPANGQGQLALHQDRVALGLKNAWDPACVIWLPLCDIDEFTPSLDVCPVPMYQLLSHKKDAAGYSVLADNVDKAEIPLVTITRMRMGQALWMHSTTLHRTSVHHWHTKDRISLDLRFLP